MPECFDTNAAAPQNRLEYWQNAACDAYLPIECKSLCEGPFAGKITLSRLSQMSLSLIKASPHKVKRGRRQIAGSRRGYFMASFPISAPCRITQGTNEAILKPGDFAIYSTEDPYELHCPNGVHQMVLQLPQYGLLNRLPNACSLTARRLDGNTPFHRMTYAHLMQYADLIETQPEQAQHLLQESMLDLIAASLSLLGDSPLELSHSQSQTLRRAKAYIGENLRDHDLAPENVAAAMGISRRSLRRLFAQSDLSVSTYIRDTRLDRIAKDLRNPVYERQSISEIAVKWGLGNFSHFTRIFKARFGDTPSRHRQKR